MAKIQDISLKKLTNWRGVADEALKLLSKDEPPQLEADDRKALIESYTAKADVVVTMHTKLTYGQTLDMSVAENRAKKEHEQAKKRRGSELGEFDRGWFLVQYFCTGWKGLKDPDTGEELPFTHEGMRRADVQDVAQIVDLALGVSQGNDPNA